jgi:hypothetical protein
MPTKTDNTIEWGSGTLYFYPPEGGDPVAVGPVKGLTETVEKEHLDDPGLPCPLTTSLTQTVTFEAELEALSLPALWLLTGDPLYAAEWAMQNHPRLVHLAVRAKTARRRKKNYQRVIRAFLEEVKHG